MSKNNNKSIPIKNYVFLGLILVGTIFILYYIYLWYQTYKEDELNKSIMTDYLTVINYNELDSYLMENNNAVIYVSKLGDDDTIKFEHNFKKVIVRNNLKNYILYLDISNEDVNNINNKFGIDTNLPYIVVYTDGEVTGRFSINKHNFSTKKLEKYLNRIGVIDNED